MNSKISIHICPIKQLSHKISVLGDKCIAAVLCTTNDIPSLVLGNIKYLHISFSDVLDEKRNDAFTIKQAREIRAFVDDLGDTTTDLYFCCDSGESRSAALAACFMHYFDQDEMTVWKNAARYHPNELVYYLQSVACNLEITREDARELAEYNRKLFHRLIARQRNG